jgi:hypothetical protein
MSSDEKALDFPSEDEITFHVGIQHFRMHVAFAADGRRIAKLSRPPLGWLALRSAGLNTGTAARADLKKVGYQKPRLKKMPAWHWPRQACSGVFGRHVHAACSSVDSSPRHRRLRPLAQCPGIDTVAGGKLVRARAELEAVLTRAGITAEWNGGPEQGTALIHVLPELQRLERYERRAFSKRRGAIQDL